MLGKIGILTLHGDLKKSYDYDQEAIEYAMTSHMLEPSAQVLATALKLTNSEMEISNQRPSQLRAKPNPSDIGIKDPAARGRPVQDYFDWGRLRQQIGKRAHQLP
jgi:hypothetical protein